MPELPEVETVRRTLAESVVGKKIIQADILLPKMVRDCPLASFVGGVTGRSIRRVDRRGKFLLLRLDSELTLVVHLGMSGRFFYAEERPPGGFPRHTHAVFRLDDGGWLVYCDPRQFGRLTLADDPRRVVRGLGRMGPEPLEREFSASYLEGVLGRRKGRIKQVLLDQGLVAGIGNIYADEILFDARIHPERRAESLTGEEAARLHQSIRRVLRRGIRHRGTTISDYVDGRGVPGDFQNRLKAYGREGEACPRCGEQIRRIRLAGRSTYFCPGCQQQEV